MTDVLSVQELAQLGWLRWRMDAINLLGELAEARHTGLSDGDHVFARRLAWAKYLIQTGRISDDYRDELESRPPETA